MGKVTRHCLSGLLVCALGILAYSSTFDVPFLLDDEPYISENPALRDLGKLISFQWPEGEHYDVYHILGIRYMGFLSFALNHALGGLDVRGYHAVNLMIHISSAILVYILVLLAFRTPAMSGSRIRGQAQYIALIVSLLFVSHPIQTEAVTYITQRFASMAAMFCLLSLSAYSASRLSEGKASRHMLYALALASALLAMKSKETAFTLPVVIALYEASFMRGGLSKRVYSVVPFISLLPLIPLSVIRLEGGLASALADATMTDPSISRWEYLVTQPSVALTYLRLLFLPINQTLDYAYPVYSSVFSGRAFVSGLLFVALVLSVFYLYRRSVSSDPALRMVGFGIAWFVIALSVESSFITLADVIFEHRLYLPSAGAFLALSSAGALVLVGRGGSARRVALLCSFCVLALSMAAYSRNTVWRTPEGLWTDVVRKAPGKARGHNNLGIAYENAGYYRNAEREYLAAIDIDPSLARAHDNLGNIYLRHRRYNDALAEYTTSIDLAPTDEKAHNNLGVLFETVMKYDEAASEFLQALKLRPDYADAHYNLGGLYLRTGRYAEAEREYLYLLGEDPANLDLHNALGMAYLREGRYADAEREYIYTIKVDPENSLAHRNLGAVYLREGRYDEAIIEMQTAVDLAPQDRTLRMDLEVAREMAKTRKKS